MLCGMMSAACPQPDLTVARTLALWPGTAAAFVRLGTDCVGCPLARFCTLDYIARTYRLSMQAVLAELQGCLPADREERSA